MQLNRLALLVTLLASFLLPRAARAQTAPVVAGTLYVDLRSTNAVAGTAIWTNFGTLGNFAVTSAVPISATNNVLGTEVTGVLFTSFSNAFIGPVSVADLEGSSDRSIEVWALNPSFVSEEAMVSWSHHGVTRRHPQLPQGAADHLRHRAAEVVGGRLVHVGEAPLPADAGDQRRHTV